MNQNTYDTNRPCCNRPCPCPMDPIVMPTRVCCVNRCHYVEQPVIIPVHTRVVNHYVPAPRYYTTYTTSEETVCHGNRGNQQNQ